MDEATLNFCSLLRNFCNDLQSKCTDLKASVEKRAIDHESSLIFVLEGLESRAKTTNTQVEALQSMAMENVSFRELVGHCNQVYLQNQHSLSILEDCLRERGYDPGEIEVKEVEEESPSLSPCPPTDKLFDEASLLKPTVGFETEPDFQMSASTLSPVSSSSATPGLFKHSSYIHSHSSDFVSDVSLSLQDLDLSSTSLALLANEENTNAVTVFLDVPRTTKLETFQHIPRPHQFSEQSLHGYSDTINISYRGDESENKTEETSVTKEPSDRANNAPLLQLTKTDYDKEPSWVRSLVTWEELNSAVNKFNHLLQEKAIQDGSKQSDILTLDEMELLGLGRKLKSYLVVLVRMKQLTLEHQSGVAVYRARC